MASFQKQQWNHKVCKETGEYGHWKEQNKLTENIPEDIESLNLLDKDLKQLY